MDAGGILDRLRRGAEPTRDELSWFAKGLATGQVDDAQAGAFAMGICLNPLTSAGRIALTLAMRDSGRVLRWDLPGSVLDKHSTGGVGDPVSLILGPALAALGAYVPMLSGRGLGHSGGTLDKLESIPGLRTTVTPERFQDLVAETGCGIVAASDDIAPADRRLYGIRDVTGTVQSIDLITASILSKKLAGGVGPLVLDVKMGSGAFMTDLSQAEALARALVDTANGAGGPCSALITDMNQPCIPAAGNALEIMEVIEVLTDPDDHGVIEQLVAALGGELMRLSGLAETQDQGAAQVMDALMTGAAAERFGRMISGLGGPVDFVEIFRDRLPAAPIVRQIDAPFAGVVTTIDGHALGQAVVDLGGGRRRAGDKIDPSVGLSDIVMIGDPVEAGDPLALIHGADEDTVDALAVQLVSAFTLGDQAQEPPLIYKVVT